MVSQICLFMKLIICFGLICTLISYSNTQPIYNNDENDQMQIYDDIYTSHSPRYFYDYHPRELLRLYNQQYHPDGLQLAKRIIMLPRVGRRSIRSTLES